MDLQMVDLLSYFLCDRSACFSPQKTETSVFIDLYQLDYAKLIVRKTFKIDLGAFFSRDHLWWFYRRVPFKKMVIKP